MTELLFILLLALHHAHLAGVDLGEHGQVDEEGLVQGGVFDQLDSISTIGLRLVFVSIILVCCSNYSPPPCFFPFPDSFAHPPPSSEGAGPFLSL